MRRRSWSSLTLPVFQRGALALRRPVTRRGEAAGARRRRGRAAGPETPRAVLRRLAEAAHACPPDWVIALADHRSPSIRPLTHRRRRACIRRLAFGWRPCPRGSRRRAMSRNPERLGPSPHSRDDERRALIAKTGHAQAWQQRPLRCVCSRDVNRREATHRSPHAVEPGRLHSSARRRARDEGGDTAPGGGGAMRHEKGRGPEGPRPSEPSRAGRSPHGVRARAYSPASRRRSPRWRPPSRGSRDSPSRSPRLESRSAFTFSVMSSPVC